MSRESLRREVAFHLQHHGSGVLGAALLWCVNGPPLTSITFSSSVA